MWVRKSTFRKLLGILETQNSYIQRLISIAEKNVDKFERMIQIMEIMEIRKKAQPQQETEKPEKNNKIS